MSASSRTERWIQGYLSAWRDNDPSQIGALFGDDASYYTAPYRSPWQGRQAIVARWLERKDEPGSWSFRFQVVSENADLGVVEGVTEYPRQGRTYNNLGLIWFNEDGSCRKFVEYFMLQE